MTKIEKNLILTQEDSNFVDLLSLFALLCQIFLYSLIKTFKLNCFPIFSIPLNFILVLNCF